MTGKTNSMTTINRLKELISAATPGPWHYGVAYSPKDGEKPYSYCGPGYYDNAGILGTDGTTVVGCDEYHIFNSEGDIALIVEAVNALPDLIATIARLESENAELRAEVGLADIQSLANSADFCDKERAGNEVAASPGPNQNAKDLRCG